MRLGTARDGAAGPRATAVARRGTVVTPVRLASAPLLLAVLAGHQLQAAGAGALAFSGGPLALVLYCGYGLLALAAGVVHGALVRVWRDDAGRWHYRTTLALVLPLVLLAAVHAGLEVVFGADHVALPLSMVLLAGVLESAVAHLIIGRRTIWHADPGSVRALRRSTGATGPEPTRRGVRR